MPLDPRDIVDPQLIGTKLRDAAVDPEPTDYLPPVNAGLPGEDGNPHGPNVVSPEIHGSQGTRPILPGLVSNDAAAQSTAEQDHTQVWHPDTVVAPEV